MTNFVGSLKMAKIMFKVKNYLILYTFNNININFYINNN